MFFDKKFITSLICLLLISGCAKAGNDNDILEPEPQVDTAALEDVYSEILDIYYYELMHPRVYDSDYVETDVNGNILKIYAKTKDDKGGSLDYVGYGFCDQNDDGIIELVIEDLMDNEEQDKMICSVYSLRNNFPKDYVVKKWEMTHPDLTPFSKYSPKTEDGYYDNVVGEVLGQDFSSWQEGYLEWLSQDEIEVSWNSYLESGQYALIYVDDDDIPELVQDGSTILSYHDGVVTVYYAEDSPISYIERKNLVNCSHGKMGAYYDHVVCLKDGLWQNVFDGKYWADEWGFEIDEETGRYLVDHYSVNRDENYNQKTYLEAWHNVFDENTAIVPSDEVSYEEIINILNE